MFVMITSPSKQKNTRLIAKNQKFKKNNYEKININESQAKKKTTLLSVKRRQLDLFKLAFKKTLPDSVKT